MPLRLRTSRIILLTPPGMRKTIMNMHGLARHFSRMTLNTDCDSALPDFSGGKKPEKKPMESKKKPFSQKLPLPPIFSLFIAFLYHNIFEPFNFGLILSTRKLQISELKYLFVVMLLVAVGSLGGALTCFTEIICY